MKSTLLKIAILGAILLTSGTALAADRYWVGGSGTWDTVTTTHWSTSTGGSTGASVPTSSDNVFFDANSGGGTLTMADVAKNTLSLDFSGYTGSISGGATIAGVTVFGSLNMGTTMTNSSSLRFTMAATTSGWTVTCGGKGGNNGLAFTGVGGGWTLQDNWVNTGSGSSPGGSLNITNGTLNANNFNVTVPSVNATGGTINMGNGTWTLTATSGFFWTATSVTINAASSTIKMTGTVATTMKFVGGGKTYNNLWFSPAGGTGSITISGSNTFNDFKDDGTAAHSLLFTSGTTQTLATFTVSGSAGNIITINSNDTATHALVKTGGGTISRDYLNIQHSVATPSLTWYAGTHSTNNQANASAGSGWIFTAPPSLNTFNFWQWWDF